METKQLSYGSSFSHETTIWPTVNSSQEHRGVAHKLYHWHLQTHWKKGFRTKNFVYTYFVTFFLAFRFAGTLAGTLALCDTRGYVTHSSHNTDIILRKLSSHTGYCVAPTGESSSWHTWAVTRSFGDDWILGHCSKFDVGGSSCGMILKKKWPAERLFLGSPPLLRGEHFFSRCNGYIL